MNYKVVLVDDEPEVLRSIQKKIKWEDYGFEVAGLFSNGRDVLEFLENNEADIIFTDIRMPFMDGIELVRAVRERYSYIGFVIISGYDDFEYAREAMVYGVLDYILKPINAKELSDVLLRVRERIDADLAERKNMQKLKKMYMENLSIICENFLNRLVTGSIRKEELEEELPSLWVGSADNRYWVLALIQIDRIEHRDQGKTIDRPLAFVYIRSLIQREFSQGIWYQTFYNDWDGEGILFGMKKTEEIEKILRELNDIVRESWQVMQIGISVGVGNIKSEVLKVKDSFDEAKEALAYSQISKDGNVIYMEDVAVSNQTILLFDRELRDKLFTAVKFGDKKDIAAVMDEMRECFSGLDMRKNNYQIYCINAVNALLEFVQQQNIEIDGFVDGLLDYIEVIRKYVAKDIFLQWFEEQCQCVNDYLKKEGKIKAKNIIEIARNYIEQEYRNPDIGLEKVAEEVGLTQTYFSSLFKKETGKSFVEYLTDVRMKEAMRLLKETDEKIYMVGKKTGYPESGYFSHVFKKKFGVSPIQYRRQDRS